MKVLIYFINLLSRLPLRIHYLFSDIIFFLIYYVVNYRKKVVMGNLSHSFPEKNPQEIKQIGKSFFKNFADYLVETAKTFTISEDELRVRVQHINQDVFHNAKKEGKNIILLTGHVFNWEWFTPLATIVPQAHCYPVYRKVQNAFWEDEIRKIRNRFGNTALEANEVIRHILKTSNDGDSIYMFVADQSPYVGDVNYGLNFMNQKTPVFIGYDKLATRLDLIFVYCEMKKVKRGFYQANYYRIDPDGEKFAEYEVVKKFHKLLESTIRKRPDNYLWSHRKWKYAGSIKKFDGETVLN